MKNSIKQTIIRGLVVAALPIAMTGCHHEPSSANPNQTAGAVAGCSGNPYLAKYGCSIERIQSAAENGNPDAQYALGYMYYYGIDTVKDQQTAQLWIQRAAAQGQPLAKKAWSLIHSGSSFNDLHQAASQSLAQTSQQASTIQYQPPENVDKLNATQHSEPVTNHLPAYNNASNSSSPVVDGGADSDSGSQNLSQNTPSHAPQWGSKQMADATQPAIKHDKINDPRMMNDAKPQVASADSSMRAVMDSAPAESSAPKVAPMTRTASAQSYTIQLLASDKISDVKGYIADHRLDQKAQYYRTEMNGKPWYMLTYGNYDSEKSAQTALAQLPQNLTRHHPWVKSFATVKEEVRSQKVTA